MLNLFHRPTQRPTPHERRALTLALLATGDHPARDVLGLFHWAADRANWIALDLILEGAVGVDVDGGEVLLGRLDERAEWVDTAVEEVMA